MSDVKTLTNVIEIIQEFYNLIEGSAKRHVMFKKLINLTDDKSSKT